MRAGAPLRAAEPLDASRSRFEADLEELPIAARSLTDPVAPVARISPALQRLTADVGAAARRHAGPGTARPLAQAHKEGP
jgi:nicotinate phosphoribosyltransferase